MVSTTRLAALEELLRSEFGEIEEVGSVRIEFQKSRGEEIKVWTSLDKDTREIRFRVYDKEEKLMAAFPEELFDFHVHPSEKVAQ